MSNRFLNILSDWIVKVEAGSIFQDYADLFEEANHPLWRWGGLAVLYEVRKWSEREEENVLGSLSVRSINTQKTTGGSTLNSHPQKRT